jgi:hypothetical protein
MDGIFKTAEVVPMDSDVLNQARGIQVALGMSMQDSIVLATVVAHLVMSKPTESCFLNRNTKDFDDPNVRDILEESGCRFFGGFDDALKYIEANLRRPENS